jgi:thiol-disulfide isomerase/thioredoxin
MRIARLAALTVLAFALPAAGARAAEDLPLAIGAAAPPVSEPTGAGTFDSSRSTRPYVVEFFAVWCPHCQHEVPVVNELERVDGKRIDVIAVPASPFGFDRSSMLDQAALADFAARFHTGFRIGFDGFFSSAYDYGVAQFPTFFFVSGDRRIVAVESGEVPFERLHADVQRALAAAPGS